MSLQDNITLIFVKSLMGVDTPEYFKFVKTADTAVDGTSIKSTFLSGCDAVIKEDGSKLQGIMKRANHYKIGTDIVKFAEKYRDYQKKKEHDRYALIVKGAKFMPLDNVPESDAYFSKYYHKFPFSWRTKIASKLFEAATKTPVKNLSIHTLAYAKPAEFAKIAFDRGHIAEFIKDRSYLTQDPQYKKVYESLSKVALLKETNLLKLAETIERLDKCAKIYPYNKQRDMYGAIQQLCDPITEIASSLKKKAQELPIKTHLRSLPYEFYHKVFGHEKAASIISNDFDTLTKQDAYILGKYLKTCTS